MSVALARVAFDSVERLRRYRELHPDVLIELHTAPAWHWSAWLPGGREVVNFDLAMLLDQLSALTGV